MPSYSAECQEIFAYLRSLSLHYQENWVVECINYYKSTNAGITVEELKNEVLQQWLLVNLRTLKKPSLPSNLASHEKIMLPGKYAVQVETMIDCSESCYSQLQRLRNGHKAVAEHEEKPNEREPKSSRCLTFTLCDGVQEIEGMEYKPISKIKTNDPDLLPGFKMVIIGPVECRKGMLLLQNENIKVWGGEVDTLCSKNGFASLLLKKLDLDETYLDETENQTDQLDNIINQTENEVQRIQPARTNLQNQQASLLLSEDEDGDDILLNLDFEPDVPTVTAASQVSSVNNVQHTQHMQNNRQQSSYSDVNCDSYDWRKMDYVNTPSLNFNQTNSASLSSYNNDGTCRVSTLPSSSNSNNTEKRNINHVSRPQSALNNRKNSNDSLDDEDDDDDDDIVFQPQTNNKRIKVDSVGANTPKINSTKKNQKNLTSYLKISSKKSNTTSDSDQKCGSSKSGLPVEPKELPVTVDKEPFVYLQQIINSSMKKPSLFTVKAIILTLRSKVSIIDDQFQLKANISDGSLSIDVNFSSDVLEDMLGFSPCEMIVMMKEKNRNSAIADRIKKAFQTSQEKLISLNCLMKIRFFQGGTIPCVESLEEVGHQHLNMLRTRKVL